MRPLLVLLSLSVACCVHSKEAPPVPPTAPPTGLEVEFAPPGEPKEDQLFVCGKQKDGVFWCLDYELFLEHMAAENTKGSIQL